MSTLTIALPQPQLQWWKLRLRPNEDGQLMRITANGTLPGMVGDLPSATEAVYEIFDGCEGELRGVVSSVQEGGFGRYILYVLAYGKPSDADWEPLEKVALYPREAEPSDFIRDEWSRQGIYG
jgi:hypothetical protein